MMVFWITLITLPTCLAFSGPVAVVVRNNLAFPQRTHRLPPTAFSNRRGTTAPSRNSVPLFGSGGSSSKNKKDSYSYDICGKLNKTEKTSGLSRKQGSKRRTLRGAAKNAFKTIKKKAYEKIFREIDTDGDGLLSKSELQNYSEKGKLLSKEDEEELLTLLRDLGDRNGKGVVDKSEFDQRVAELVVSKLVLAEVIVSKNVASTAMNPGNFSLPDADGDGSIGKKEFANAPPTSSPPSLSSVDDTDEEDIKDALVSSLNDLEPLERQEMRLGGFDPYILVSALTAGSSFEVINENSVEWNEVVEKASLLALTPEDWFFSALLFIAGLSTVMGTYAVIVFSLTLLYGRTALGMDRNEEYFDFLENTEPQRFRGFKAFSISLGLFCVVVAMELFQKTPSAFRIPIVVASVAFLYIGAKEYASITEAAAPIFAETDWNNDDDDDDDDDADR